jgi:guanylate kinase
MLMLIFGPTGVGKSTIISSLVDDYQFSCVVTYTTRPARTDDRFKRTVSEQEFDRLVSRGFLFRSKPPIGGFRYGESALDLSESRSLNGFWCLDMSISSFDLYKEFDPLNVIVLPKDADQLKDQLASCDREDRIERALSELASIQCYATTVSGDKNWHVLLNVPSRCGDVAAECARLARPR